MQMAVVSGRPLKKFFANLTRPSVLLGASLQCQVKDNGLSKKKKTNKSNFNPCFLALRPEKVEFFRSLQIRMFWSVQLILLSKTNKGYTY